MYNQFFGLQKNPFNLTPDPEFLFLTQQHREALAGLTYAIIGRKGFLVLTGDAGTGKTTLTTRVLRQLPESRVRASVVFNPILTPSEFMEMMLHDFGIIDVPVSKAQRLIKLEQLLVEGDRENKISVLIVDEAHRLSPDVLEELRLLGNFERSDRKLLQILFLGQPELADTLNRSDLSQLKQRVAARFKISPLAPAEIENYIQHRWIKAGGCRPTPFTAGSIDHITCYSRGIPRIINAICDNALIQAIGEGVRVVQPGHVLEVCSDLDLDTTVAPKAMPMIRNGNIQSTLLSEPSRPASPSSSILFERNQDSSRNRSFLTRLAGKSRITN
jgi:general secretion pathway protein A